MKLSLLTCVAALWAASSLEGLNTKIGWPTQYWQSGSFTAFIVLVGLIWWTIRLMIRTADQTGETDGPLLGIVVLMIAAGSWLQTLPDTANGIQLLPIPPWRYAGWISSIVSTGVWCLGGLAVALSMTQGKDGPSCFSFLMLIAMGLNATLSFAGIVEATSGDVVSIEQTSEVEGSVSDPEAALDQWRCKADTIRRLIERLENDRRTIDESLTRISRSDIVGGSEEELNDEREDLTDQIDRLRAELVAVESAVIRAESNLRRIRRQQMLEDVEVVTDDNFESLSRLQRELQDLADASH